MNISQPKLRSEKFDDDDDDNDDDNNNRRCTRNSTPVFSTFSDVTILAKQAANQFKSNVFDTRHSMTLI